MVLLRGHQPAPPRQLLAGAARRRAAGRAHFRAFAATVERDGGATYATICRDVADDDEVLSLLDGAPLPQRRPLLLLAAVHFLLLAGADHPLAAYYDTVALVRGVPFGPPRSGDVAAAFADFCRAHRAELERLIAIRSTQTNEVGRCTALLPGLCHIAALYGWSEPLSLLDLGTSAGSQSALRRLRLHLPVRRRGRRSARPVPGRTPPWRAVALTCTARRDVSHLPELRLPAMAERVGLDLAPVDPFSDDEARWLLACLWPDNPVRFGRLRAALANVRAAAHPPRLERGDMLTDLPPVAATMPGDGPLVVFHSWVAAYLTEAEQRALVAQVAALGHVRPVHYLYCESPFETPGLPTPPSPVPRRGPDLATALVHVAPGGGPPCGWPTPTPTATGSAGGRRPPARRRAPKARRGEQAPAPRPR